MSITAPAVNWRAVATLIDHTNLKTEATRVHIEQTCREAMQYSFATVCILPYWTETCVELLKGSGVKTGAAVGFPQGATLPSVKLFETQAVLARGAQEIDMVINVGALKERNVIVVENEIRAIADACHSAQALLKVIIECALLSDDEKKLACELSVKAGADFVKTSTGMSIGGATVADVRLMRSIAGPNVGVKAAGGIRTASDTLAMIEAGANRVGASSSVAIVKELGAE